MAVKVLIGLMVAVVSAHVPVFPKQYQSDHRSCCAIGQSCFPPHGKDAGHHSFLVGFLHNTISFKKPIRFYVYTARPTTITVAAPLIGFNKTVFLLASSEVTVGEVTVTPDHTGVYPLGFHVTSSEPIRLYSEKVDIDTILPERKLANKYVLLSWYNNAFDYETELGIVGTADNTIVTINFNNGTVWNQVINRYELFQYQSMYDLSGSFISASRDIAVLAGHRCTKAGGPQCDHLFRVIPPIQQFKRQHIVTSPAPGRHYMVRIVAVSHQTAVTLSTGVVFTLGMGKIAWYTFKDTAISVTSNKPVMVAAYAFSGKGKAPYDPAQLIVPGLAHFKSFYGFFVPHDIVHGKLAIIFPVYASPFPCIKMNGRMIAPIRPKFVFVPGKGKYMVFYVPVTAGEIAIYTTNGTPFGAYMLLRKPQAESWFSLPFHG